MFRRRHRAGLVHLFDPLRGAVGGSLAGWLGLGAVAAVVLSYRAGLRWLRSA